ncbi:glycosyltransferase family 2 protein [Gammaproteobacteria bacterium]|nr:glycosyltransferase family 2 protein [Gammaproteobacteria bacterium]
MKCSIIIPNFNGETLLQQNLPSVINESKKFNNDCEVIVVDDASSDNSVKILQAQFPSVKLVQHKINKGFAEGIHSGVAAAKYELVFLLNSDVQPLEGCLNKLEKYFERADTFAVNPLILNQDNEVNQSSWTRSQFSHGRLKLRPWDTSDLPAMKQSDEAYLTLYCSGGSVMMRKEMFEELGGFSDLYKPFYYEDFDLGLRAWYQGWSSYFYPCAEVIHADKGTIEDHFKSDLIKSTQRRNRYFLEWVHFPKTRLIFSTIPFTLMQLLGELVLLDKKNIKAFYAAITQFKTISASRKAISTKKLQLNEIINLTDD